MKQFISILFLLSFALLSCKQELPEPPEYTITCYAAVYAKGIFKTDNGGKSWYSIDRDQVDLYAYFKRIYPDPLDRDSLLVTTTGAGLFRLDLKKKTLENNPLFEEYSLSAVVSRVSSTSTEKKWDMFVATHGHGIFLCRNGLGHCSEYNRGLIYRDVNTLLSCGKNLYAGTVKDLFKWDEDSGQWITASKGICNKNILCIAGDEKTGVLFAGAGAYQGKRGFFEKIPCLYKSTDQGLTWVPSFTGIPDSARIYAIAINPESPGRIYAGTSKGIYRSTNGGDEWVKMEQGLPGKVKVFDIRIARMPDGKDVVYAATSEGVFMTVDDDVTRWAGRNYGLEPSAVTSLLPGDALNLLTYGKSVTRRAERGIRQTK